MGSEARTRKSRFRSAPGALTLVAALAACLACSRSPHGVQTAAEGSDLAAGDPFVLEALRLGYVDEPRPGDPWPAGSAGEPEPITAREFLARHHGERWPAIEREIEAAGIDLDVPYEPARWEDVAPELEQGLTIPPEELEAMVARRVDWPAQLDVRWLEERHPTERRLVLEAGDLPRIEREVAGFNAELRALAESWSAQVDFHVRERVQSGSYLRAPFTTVGLGQDVGFYSRSVAGHGWAATVTLRREDLPEVFALENEIHALRSRRDEVVGRQLASFGR